MKNIFVFKSFALMSAIFLIDIQQYLNYQKKQQNGEESNDIKHFKPIIL